MLALMPQTHPVPDFHRQSSMGHGSMSLAILPPRSTYNQQVVPTLLAPLPSPSKRPRLSLNTSSVTPVFGKASTSLRLETLSATSPTTRNTFANAQKPVRSPLAKTNKPPLTPLATHFATHFTQDLSPSNIELPDSAVSATSVSTIDSIPSEVPYKLPFNASSILINGPIPRTRSPRISFAQSRPMFPAPKRVSFSTVLTEEITTTRYTTRDIDVELAIAPTAETPVAAEGIDNGQVEDAKDTETELRARPSLQIGTKPESRLEAEDSDCVPVTPVAGRGKKERQWVWTLGPITSEA